MQLLRLTTEYFLLSADLSSCCYEQSIFISGPSGLIINTDYVGLNTDILITWKKSCTSMGESSPVKIEGREGVSNAIFWLYPSDFYVNELNLIIPGLTIVILIHSSLPRLQNLNVKRILQNFLWNLARGVKFWGQTSVWLSPNLQPFNFKKFDI